MQTLPEIWSDSFKLIKNNIPLVILIIALWLALDLIFFTIEEYVLDRPDDEMATAIRDYIIAVLARAVIGLFMFAATTTIIHHYFLKQPNGHYKYSTTPIRTKQRLLTLAGEHVLVVTIVLVGIFVIITLFSILTTYAPAISILMAPIGIALLLILLYLSISLIYTTAFCLINNAPIRQAIGMSRDRTSNNFIYLLQILIPYIVTYILLGSLLEEIESNYVYLVCLPIVNALTSILLIACIISGYPNLEILDMEKREEAKTQKTSVEDASK